MLHTQYNIKIIRGLSGLNQTKFATLLGVSLAMQKSYEIGRAAPDGLYMQRLSSLSGVNEKDLKSKRINASEIHIKVEKDEKENQSSASIMQNQANGTVSQEVLLALVESNRELVQSNRKLVDTHYDLVQMAKASTVHDVLEKQRATNVRLAVLHDYMVEFVAEKKKVPVEQINEILSKKEHDLEKVLEGEGIHAE